MDTKVEILGIDCSGTWWVGLEGFRVFFFSVQMFYVTS